MKTVGVLGSVVAVLGLSSAIAVAQPAENPAAPAAAPTGGEPGASPAGAAPAQPGAVPATGVIDERPVPHQGQREVNPGIDAEPEEFHEEEDPSKHFNFFDTGYRSKDVVGGPLGDSKNVNPATGDKVPGDEEPMSAPFALMLVNFAILLGILAWKMRPAAHQLAAERHDQIKSALEEAAALRQKAADQLAQYETKLKSADAEIAALVEGMRKDAEADKARILANAEAQAAQMKRDAELRIAAEIELARAVLTREVTAAAAAATEKLVREKFQPGDQARLVGAFITDVAAAPQSKERA